MSYTDKEKQKLVRQICKELTKDGKDGSIRNILKKKKYPSNDTFYSWINSDIAMMEHYTRACVIRADVNVEETKAIADDKSNDMYTDDKGNERPNNVAVSRASLQIDTRLKLAALQAPKKYGKQIDITTGGDKIQPAAVNIKIDSVNIAAALKL